MSRRLAGFLQTLALGGLFWWTAPRTPQEGDTTELVLAGLRFLLPHPPGYPLQVLWNKLVLTLVPVSPYFAVALGSVALGLVLYLLLRRFETDENGSGLAAGVFLTSFLTWRWVILPDVFVGLLCFGALFLLVFQRSQRYQNFLWLFLLSLSVAHHQSIIFFLPLLIVPMWRYRTSWRHLCFAFGALMVSLSTYFLLLLFNDEDLGSWGKVDTVSDVLRFFLRQDFGTGQLSASGRRTDLFWVFGNFFITWVTNFWALSLLACVSLWRWSKKPDLVFLRSNSAILLALVAYLGIFFPRANLSIDVPGEATLGRFYLLPLLLLWALHLRAGVLRRQVLATTLLTLNLMVNLVAHFPRNDFSKDSTVVDWMKNAFAELPLEATVFFSGDMEWNVAVYLQSVEGLRGDLALLGPLSIEPKDFIKTAKNYPERFALTGHFVERITPAMTSFYSNEYALPFLTGRKRNATGIMVKYEAGTGDIEFSCRPSFSRKRVPSVSAYRERETRLSLELSYGTCHFLQGLRSLAVSQYSAASESFRLAYQLAPGLVQSLERRCYTQKAAGLDDSDCQRELDLALESYDPLYLPK